MIGCIKDIIYFMDVEFHSGKMVAGGSVGGDPDFIRIKNMQCRTTEPVIVLPGYPVSEENMNHDPEVNYGERRKVT